MNLTLEQLMDVIRAHKVNGTWCYGCQKRVNGQAHHLAFQIAIADELAGCGK